MGQRIATVGVFDGVHRGHAFLLDTLAGLGGERGLTPTAFTFERHPAAVVAPDRVPASLCSLKSKIELIEARGVDCELLDFDTRLSRLDAAEFMALLRERYAVAALLMGYDNRIGHGRDRDIERLRRDGASAGVEVIECPRMPGGDISSSAIRRAIASGRMLQATEMLGRQYSITGRVGHGMHQGTGIGFPTANLVPADKDQLVPADGVYACRAMTSDRHLWPAMVNIGIRPTTDDGRGRTIEAHLIGFEGNLYDHTLELRFAQRIRDERRFDSLEALGETLSADRRQTLSILSEHDINI